MQVEHQGHPLSRLIKKNVRRFIRNPKKSWLKFTGCFKIFFKPCRFEMTMMIDQGQQCMVSI